MKCHAVFSAKLPSRPIEAIRHIRLGFNAFHKAFVWLCAALFLIQFEAMSAAADRTVTNTNDSGAGSLRDAIIYANVNPAEDAILFAIPGVGPHTITLATNLPDIIDDGVSIDGSTQSGASCGTATDVNGVLTDRVLKIVIDANTATSRTLRGTSDNVVVKGLALIRASSQGLLVESSANDLSVICNHIGVDYDGTTAAGNSQDGIYSNGPSINIGDGTAAGGNIIAHNGRHGVFVNASAAAFGEVTGNTIRNNAMHGIRINGANNFTIGGTSSADRNIFTNNTQHAIRLVSSDNTAILGNFLGVQADGVSDGGNNQMGIYALSSDNLIIGDGTAAGRNIIGWNGAEGIRLFEQTGASIAGNYIGVGADGLTRARNTNGGIEVFSRDGQPGHVDTEIIDNVITGNSNFGIQITSNNVVQVGSAAAITIQGNKMGVAADGVTFVTGATAGIINANVPGTILVGGTGAGEGNIIANNFQDGVRITGAGAQIALLGNSIYSNNNLSIDIDNDDVTLNDAGDVDAGPNDTLNFPEINFVTANGTTSVMYDVNLDVPAHTEGYRIEFFDTDGIGVDTHGEGKIFLGSVDTGNHAGGDLNFTGTFTSGSNVTSGLNITATATRKTGATSYDITSEFSENYVDNVSLVVTNTNDSGPGSLRTAISNANFVTDEDDITFAIPGAGPHVISLLSLPPEITDPGISIDGTTQSGASCGQLTTGTPHTL